MSDQRIIEVGEGSLGSEKLKKHPLSYIAEYAKQSQDCDEEVENSRDNQAVIEPLGRFENGLLLNNTTGEMH